MSTTLNKIYIITLKHPQQSNTSHKKLYKAYVSRQSANAAARVLLRQEMGGYEGGSWRIMEEFMDNDKLYHGMAQDFSRDGGSLDQELERVKVKVEIVDVVKGDEGDDQT